MPRSSTSPARVRQVHRVRSVEHVRVGVDHRVDLLHRGHRRLEGVVELAELLQRVEEAVQVRDERHKHTDLKRVAADQRAAVPEDDDDGDCGDELHEREVQAALYDGAHVDVAVSGVGHLEPLVVALLAAEGLEHANPGDGLLQVRAHVADLVADLGVGARRPRAEQQGRRDEEWHDGKRGERETPIEDEQEHDGADEGERVGDQGGDAVGDELVQRVDVVGQPADDPAGLLAAEEVEAQFLQVGEELAPQVVDHVFADPAREVRLQVAGAEVDERDADEGDDDPGEDGHVLGADAAVDRDFEQIRDGEARERDHDHGDDAEGGAPSIRIGEASEPGELELARQMQERAPALDLLEAGAAAVRAAAVTGGGGHQAAPPRPPGRRPPAARAPLPPASSSPAASRQQPSRSASPNMCA